MARAIILAGSLAAGVSVLVSSIYLHSLHKRVSSQTTRSKGRLARSSPGVENIPKSLPSHIASDPDSWTVHYERVLSKPIPVSDLNRPPAPRTVAEAAEQRPPSSLMQLYAQTIHLAFSRTPQAFILRSVMRNEQAKGTFSAEYLKTLEFQPGQRVNGAYTVVYVGPGGVEGSERIELALDPTEGYNGPTPQGRIIAEIQTMPDVDGRGDGGTVVFVNETWMWRKLTEPKTLLEGGIGAWVHGLVSGWLILEGLKGVSGGHMS